MVLLMAIPPGRRASKSVALVWAAPLSASLFAEEGMGQAGARDERCAAEFVGETARQAVADWVMAVDGSEGDWRPSLRWLDVVELLDGPPGG
jgi:hypothetical protein